MADEQKCPHCGKPVPPTALQGICPDCMLKAGLASQTDAGPVGPHGTKVVSPPPPAPQEIAPLFPNLEILECLGRGGMGAVYKARQPKLNRLVALKLLAPEKDADPKFAERFLREAQTLARLSHPNIVTVHDFGEVGGRCYLVMEFVDGLNLRQLIGTRKLAPEQAITIVPKICEALQFAHEHGIVHRDIKPENILLDKDGRVKIADFGIAKILGREGERANLTAEQQIIGTPHYMAPEQIEHPLHVDHRADIYSLGVVFYEMLTGELPLGKFAPPSQKVQVDVRLDEVVLHALEKEPERRYQQASQVKTDVETISAGVSLRGETKTGSDKQERRSEEKGSVHAALSSAQTRVTPPAIGLLAVGLLNLLPLVLLAITLLVRVIFYARAPGLPSNSGQMIVFAWLPVLFGLGIGFLLACASVLILFGAMRMMRLRNHGLAVTSSILAMLTPPGLVLGLPFGIWSLVVLNRREVREAFEANRSGTAHGGPGAGRKSTPYFSRTAIVGACWAALFLVTGIGVALVTSATATAYRSPAMGLAPQGAFAPGPLLLLLALPGLTAPLGTTILGWVAVSQIRRSGGRLYGLGLAVFDGLLFPFLALVAVLGFLWLSLGDWIHPALGISTPSLGFILLVGVPWLVSSVLLCGWVTHHVWRVVNQPAGASGQPDQTRRSTRALWKMGAATAALLLCGTVFVWWVQRPSRIGNTLSEDSPDGRYSALAQTFHAMRIFGQDELYYRFTVQGLGGAIFNQWSISVPVAKLSTNYLAQPLAEYAFDQHGAIEWSADSKRVYFRVRDVEVSEYNVAESVHTEVAAGLEEGNRAVVRSSGSGPSAAKAPPMATSISKGTLTTEGTLITEGTFSAGEAVGSTTERVLYSVDVQRPIKGEDLDSEQEIELPSDLEKRPESEFFHWAAAHGVDLMAFAHKRSWDLWAAPKLVSVETSLWEHPDPAAVEAALNNNRLKLQRNEADSWEGFVSYGIPTNAALPLTLAFETRAGGRGLLQITGFTESPRGLKIRYQLLPARNAKFRAIPSARAIALTNELAVVRGSNVRLELHGQMELYRV